MLSTQRPSAGMDAWSPTTVDPGTVIWDVSCASDSSSVAGDSDGRPAMTTTPPEAPPGDPGGGTRVEMHGEARDSSTFT